MASKLWFIKEDDVPVAVFDSKVHAQEEKESLANENEDCEYRIYSLSIEDLEDNSTEYEEEYELALQEGFF
ncbi:MAG: hypothetical protein JW760_06285 [Spirochaetales bacterium]|nr:hypothetical protein [Spirochaetales bacterium]